MGREDEIRIIAYHIWEQEGRCHGRDCEHYLKAEAIWEEKQRNTDFPAGTRAKAKKPKIPPGQTNNDHRGEVNSVSRKNQGYEFKETDHAPEAHGN